jgi:hypothetical protein
MVKISFSGLLVTLNVIIPALPVILKDKLTFISIYGIISSMNQKYPRNESLEKFAAKRQAWDLETGPRPPSRILVIGGAVVSLALLIEGVRNFADQPGPANVHSRAPIETAADHTPPSCEIFIHTVEPGDTELDIAITYFPGEDPYEVVNVMENTTAMEQGVTRTIWPDDQLKVQDPDCVLE